MWEFAFLLFMLFTVGSMGRFVWPNRVGLKTWLAWKSWGKILIMLGLLVVLQAVMFAVASYTVALATTFPFQAALGSDAGTWKASDECVGEVAAYQEYLEALASTEIHAFRDNSPNIYILAALGFNGNDLPSLLSSYCDWQWHGHNIMSHCTVVPISWGTLLADLEQTVSDALLSCSEAALAPPTLHMSGSLRGGAPKKHKLRATYKENIESQGLAKAIAESAAEAKKEADDERAVITLLNSRLAALRPGHELDQETPKDGHCLFHALRRAGVARLADCPCALSIAEMRGMALSMASREQLQLAAQTLRVSVQEYVEGMAKADWGDNLMIILLSITFQKPVTVVGQNIVRTYYPDGTEKPEGDDNAAWIAHRGELHYYGILKVDELGRTGDCPLCTAAMRCAIHSRELDDDQASCSEAKPAAKRLRGAVERATSKPYSKKAAPSGNHDADIMDKKRVCGNCGSRGHHATTCLEPCFACGEKHKYFECNHPTLHVEALRQAQRNRVTWKGYGSKQKQAHSSKVGMKESGLCSSTG